MMGEGTDTAQMPVQAAEAVALMRDLEQAGIHARLIGGLAIAARCQSAWAPSPLARSYSDLDIVVDRRGARILGAALTARGFVAAERFNMFNGRTRQLYQVPDGRDLDVFVESFKMCHELDLRNRLRIDPVTLPLADLLLTKLQVAELTGKDVRDIVAITLDHSIDEDDGAIDVSRIAIVTASDWGWWKTVTDNLRAVSEHIGLLGLEQSAAQRATDTVTAIADRVERQPKSMRWKARARVGTRMPWREDPEQK
jgi:hypothetical protein